MNDLEIIEEFCSHHCIVCKKYIVVFCGTPVIYIGGCCSGVYDKEKRKFHVRIVKCHYWCYQRKKEKTKTKFDLKEIKKVVGKKI